MVFCFRNKGKYTKKSKNCPNDKNNWKKVFTKYFFVHNYNDKNNIINITVFAHPSYCRSVPLRDFFLQKKHITSDYLEVSCRNSQILTPSELQIITEVKTNLNNTPQTKKYIRVSSNTIMNLLSRTITGSLASILGLYLIIIGFSKLILLIYGIALLIIGIFIFFNKKEDNIEKIKTKSNRGEK